MHKVIDNFLEPKLFSSIKNHIESEVFPWYYTDRCTDPTIPPFEKIDYDFYFCNLVYKDSMIMTDGNTWNLVRLLLEKLDIKSLMRCKINAYTKTPTLIKHKKHIDYDFEHKGAIFSLNTNDGSTVLKDEIEIKSVANRLLLFDPSIKHNSTSCTDSNRRLNININYF